MAVPDDDTTSSTILYQVAESALSEAEKNRIIACFLQIYGTVTIDYDAVAKACGSSSGHSVRVMLGKSMKKIREAAGSGVGSGTAVNNGANGAGNKTPSKRSRGTKKEVKSDGEDEDDGEETPSKKQKKARTPKTKGEVKEEVDELKSEFERIMKEEEA